MRITEDDKSSARYQRLSWDALKRSINGLINKVTASNIRNIIVELLSEDLIRGRGLFVHSCMQSQVASPAFTHVFAALAAVINSKLPTLGQLLLKRVILQFQMALRSNDKSLLATTTKFIAHLVNQQLAHEVVALEVLTLLLQNPTNRDNVETAVHFVTECGATLQDFTTPIFFHAVFDRFRSILHDGSIDKRLMFMIEGLFAIRKANFRGHPGVVPELDLVEEADLVTHEISVLSQDLDAEKTLDIFDFDPNFLENETKYEAIKKAILSADDDTDNEEFDNDSALSSENEEDDMQIWDDTHTHLLNLRRTIYLVLMSSMSFEEAGHKLLGIQLKHGEDMQINIMILECCSQETSYRQFYGLLGQRLCACKRIYGENFNRCFWERYSMIHRLDTNRLRNVAKLFAHLLAIDALAWSVLTCIQLTEDDTTSSSRIFIKILFQELAEHLGLHQLNQRLSDPYMARFFLGILPRDNTRNTRFAINFFTSIGLGGITNNLRARYVKDITRASTSTE